MPGREREKGYLRASALPVVRAEGRHLPEPLMHRQAPEQGRAVQAQLAQRRQLPPVVHPRAGGVAGGGLVRGVGVGVGVGGGVVREGGGGAALRAAASRLVAAGALLRALEGGLLVFASRRETRARIQKRKRAAAALR